MPNVLHIVYSGLGGIASVFFSLAQSNTQDNYVHSVAFYGNVPTVPDYLIECEKLGIEHSTFIRKSKFDISANKALTAWMASCKPDIVIVHLPRALSAAVAFKRANPNTIIIGVEHNPLNLKRPIDWLDSIKLQRQCDAVVFLTHSYKKAIQKKIGMFFSSQKCVVIPNGVDTTLFSKKNAINTETKTIVFGMCARLTITKDIETLIDAIALIKEMDIDFKFQLSIAGDGPNSQALSQRVDNNALTGDIVFNGFLNEAQLIEWFQCVDIYVHATQSEVMSTSVMQAMSCGLPIIASDVPGMDELVHPNCGALVEPKNVQSLAKNMILYATDNQLRESAGRGSRLRAQSHLSQQQSWNGYAALISSLQR